ncbi:DnaA regulatory inactivator Hda [Halothiobacillus diazotrophicus]|uniref:DnaA regulatory inactivator Hda n=1 Tax=Halothiobacillus diazotrophicus TaxID=1860122 RepID=A0A191ZE94_9GAMM|nr:DnaA regulatory inactivator Hda [Halothiobacillus diazotrophicus]ANJ66189.1 DnaA regulatory inactivator Hda [Halothiobacillus diazotrophicus]
MGKSQTSFKQLPLALDLNPPQSLEGFIGNDNLLLRALIMQQIEGNGELQLFVHGPLGVGKTHLAQAACFHAGGQGRRAAYLPLALDHGRRGLNRVNPQEIDLLVLDDVGSVAGDRALEFAVFDVLNRLREQEVPVLLTAARPPADLPIILPDLASRLGWGLTISVAEPSDAEKIELLTVKAHERGLVMPFETAAYLLQRLPRDTGKLLEVLDELDQASLSAQRKLSVPFVRTVLFEGG